MWERFVRSGYSGRDKLIEAIKSNLSGLHMLNDWSGLHTQVCLLLSLQTTHDSSRSRSLRTDSQQFASHVRSNEGAIDML